MLVQKGLVVANASPLLLAIDTSTAYTGLALYDGAEVLAECVWRSGRQHTAQLLPQLDGLLRQVAIERDRISAIGVALGPGSWSGLRVGLSLAKALVVASGVPLVGISTLDVLAAGQPRTTAAIYPLIRLGRDRVASARYSYIEQLQRHEADRNTTLAELCASIDGAALFCGEIDTAIRKEISLLLSEMASFATPAANLRRAGLLAELAWQRLERGEHDDPVMLEPVYLGEAVKQA
jgi:tRNA threonylcarbamoyladenosine biosynthesis protein TsaB